MAQDGPGFHLPDEILAVIPTDPYDQLDLARKITSMAICSPVSRLEAEAHALRREITGRDLVVADLKARVARLQRLLQDSDSQLRSVLEENVKLSKERESLVFASKKLSRDLSKLETFKRHLVQSLNDDNSSYAETINIRTCDQTVSRTSSWNDEWSLSCCTMTSDIGSSEYGESIPDESVSSGVTFSITPSITPRFTPVTTPKVSSAVASPKSLSTAEPSPDILSSTTSPSKSLSEGSTTFSSWYASSQKSFAPSPPRQRQFTSGSSCIDGKEFFRQARSRLSYEQFGTFLANIKELNAHRQSREETLEKAEQIFGTENKDLYVLFRGFFKNLP